LGTGDELGAAGRAGEVEAVDFHGFMGSLGRTLDRQACLLPC
jgi:hypothetical protein